MMIKQLNEKNVGIDNTGIFPGYQHEDGIHFLNDDIDNLLLNMFDMISKDILIWFPDIQSVLDVGSGAGHLGVGLKKYKSKINIISLDGNNESINSRYLEKDKHFILRTDVDYTLVDDNNDVVLFDMICSFEHFEHIQENTFDVFMKNLLKHSKKGTIIFASAATWRYSADKSHVHCNVKTKEEWHKYLTENFPLERIEDISILSEANFNGRYNNCTELLYKVI